MDSLTLAMVAAPAIVAALYLGFMKLRGPRDGE